MKQANGFVQLTWEELFSFQRIYYDDVPLNVSDREKTILFLRDRLYLKGGTIERPLAWLMEGLPISAEAQAMTQEDIKPHRPHALA